MGAQGGGLHLVGDGSLHALVGPHAALRARCTGPPSTPLGLLHNRQATLLGSSAGGVWVLLPLAEAEYKRLASMSKVLSYALPHAGGGNPRLGRAYSSTSAPLRHRAFKGAIPLLDGPLLTRFIAQLSTASQASLAESAGSTRDRVLATLRAMNFAAMLF